MDVIGDPATGASSTSSGIGSVDILRDVDDERKASRIASDNHDSGRIRWTGTVLEPNHNSVKRSVHSTSKNYT